MPGSPAGPCADSRKWARNRRAVPVQWSRLPATTYLQDNPASIEVQKPQCSGTWAWAREPPT